MSENRDELLEKYLNNELNEEEIKEFTKNIENDSNLINHIKAQQILELVLKNKPTDSAPNNLTAKVMSSINNLSNEKSKKDFFIYLVQAVLFFPLLFAIYFLNKIPTQNINNDSVLTQINKSVSSLSSSFLAIFQSQNFYLIIGSLAIVILIILAVIINFERTNQLRLNNYPKQF